MCAQNEHFIPGVLGSMAYPPAKECSPPESVLLRILKIIISSILELKVYVLYISKFIVYNYIMLIIGKKETHEQIDWADSVFACYVLI